MSALSLRAKRGNPLPRQAINPTVRTTPPHGVHPRVCKVNQTHKAPPQANHSNISVFRAKKNRTLSDAVEFIHYLISLHLTLRSSTSSITVLAAFFANSISLAVTAALKSLKAFSICVSTPESTSSDIGSE